MWTVARKLTIAWILLAVVVLIGSSVTLHMSQETKANIEKLKNQQLQLLNISNNGFIGFLNMDDQSNMLVGLEGTKFSGTLYTQTLQQIVQGESQLNQSLHDMAELPYLTTNEQHLIHEAMTAASGYEHYWHIVHQNNQTDHALAATTMYVTNSNVSNLLTTDLQTISSLAQNNISKFVQMTINESVMVTDLAELLLIITVLASVGSLVYIRLLVRPIAYLSEEANLMGKGDFSDRPQKFKRKDDLGLLSTNLHTMASEMRQMIRGIQDTAMQLTASSQEFTASAQETAKAVEESTIHVQKVAEGANEQQLQAEAALQKSLATAHEMVTMATITDTLAKESLDHVDKANVGKHNADIAAHQMRTIRDEVAAIAVTMTQLETDASTIMSTMDVIQDIAEQTNLLALNAAIEAARAGDAGRGFSVVAEEVRKLADQSRKAAQSIHTLILAVNERVTKTTAAVRSADEHVILCTNVVEESSMAFHTFSTTANEQAHEAQEGGKKANSLRMLSDESTEAVKSIAHIAKHTSITVSEIASHAEEQLATMEEVTAGAESLSHLAETLQGMIEQFIV
ncbi:methyl-accepting chemotaxis protein [Sulfoacidibacillus ferrooxidans]|uniref:Methyl-accepting chemotaxis protein n=1 Tax=Sulfoacidibacillus ferrooxidans TaxID=2005001 RepID=A0A9X2ACY9_9BACL|nr:HAMP domain-containing methyl-accepting chemotaxis protein [Sulfoacidibacillus ferrooxidans]MCI0184673.1 hypothetical protein [Sulfoacidibacillus ferrooxidans]